MKKLLPILIILIIVGITIVLMNKNKNAQEQTASEKPAAAQPENQALANTGKEQPASTDISTQSDDKTATQGLSSQEKTNSSKPSKPAAKGQYADIENDIFSGDETRVENGLTKLYTLLKEGNGKEILMKMWLSGNPELESEVLANLQNLSETDRLDFILKGLDNPKLEIKTDSLEELKTLLEVSPDPAIEKALAEEDEDFLSNISDLFIYFSDRSIYVSAEKAMDHPNKDIRESAIDYLSDKYTEKAVDMIIKGLKSQYADTVEQCGDELRFLLDAEIETNNYNDWLNWWKNNKDAWLREQGKNDEDIPAVTPIP